MFCTQCAAAHLDNARFCPQCGYAFIRPPEELASTLSSNPVVDGALPSNPSKGVRGWLLFLCISLTILSPLYIIGQLSLAWKAAAPHFGVLPNLRTAAILDMSLTICLLVFGICTGVALWAVRPGAVKMAKAYFWAIMIFVIACPIVVITAANFPEAAKKLIVEQAVLDALIAMGGSAIWLMYLDNSKRVRATFVTTKPTS